MNSAQHITSDQGTPLDETSVKLIVHLGVHRTGTTALQARFAEARKAAADMGVRFWGPKYVRQSIDPVVARAAKSLSSSGKTLAELVSIRTELDVALHEMDAEGADTLVVSDENLLGTMRRNFIDGALYPDVVARMQRLSEVLPDVPDRIYLSIRDYAQFWASSYAFSSLRNSLAPFEELKPDLLALKRDWPDVIAEVSAVFPESDIRVWPYSAEDGALDCLLADMIGLDRAARLKTPAKPRRNKGMPHAQVVAALKAKASNPALSVKELRTMANDAAPGRGEPFMPFTSDERAALSARYLKDIAWLAEAKGNVACLVGQQHSVPRDAG